MYEESPATLLTKERLNDSKIGPIREYNEKDMSRYLAS